MWFAGLEGKPQWFSNTQQMLLPDHFIEIPRPHALRQRRVGLTFGEQVVHAGLVAGQPVIR